MSQKSILITGCSAGGIGDALAQASFRRGLRVFATARTLSKIQHLKDMGMDVVALDVTDPKSLKAAVEAVREATGGTLDVLINNSGIGYSMPVVDSDLTTVRQMFEVNVFALVGTTEAFAPLLLASKGVVLNIGSMLGFAPFPYQGLYNASKAAVSILTDTLRLELEPFGVRVVLVVTGAIKTHFFDNLKAPELPPNSIYNIEKAHVEEGMTGRTTAAFATDVNDYAEHVVANALRSHPKAHFWYGGSANMIWAVSTFLWAAAWDYAFPRLFALTDLKWKIKDREQKKLNWRLPMRDLEMGF